MGLFKRVSDIISANLNDMVDRFEDPEKMLNQAIREMETAIRNTMNSAARVIANGKLLKKQLANQRGQAERWQQRATDAVSTGNDNAARHALIRKNEQEKLSVALEDELATTQSVGMKLRRQIEAMNVKLAEARRKIVTLSARKQTSQLHKQLAAPVDSSSMNEKAFGRFDRLCEKIERTEAEAEALLELTGYDGTVADVAGSDMDLEIETELAELKKHGTQ
jgi:phage shock protein A